MKELIANNKVTLSVVGVAILIVGLFAITIINPGADKSKAPNSSAIEVTLGSEDAVNEMVVYLDPLCDRCHQFTDQVIDDLNENEVKDGSLQINIRPLSIFSEHSSKLNEINLCSHDQGKYLASSLLIGDRIFNNNTDTEVNERATDFLDDNPVEFVTKELNLDSDQFNECMKDNKNLSKLTEQDDQASEADIYSTPTIFVNNNDPIRGYSQPGYIRSQLSNR